MRCDHILTNLPQSLLSFAFSAFIAKTIFPSFHATITSSTTEVESWQPSSRSLPIFQTKYLLKWVKVLCTAVLYLPKHELLGQINFLSSQCQNQGTEKYQQQRKLKEKFMFPFALPCNFTLFEASKILGILRAKRDLCVLRYFKSSCLKEIGNSKDFSIEKSPKIVKNR